MLLMDMPEGKDDKMILPSKRTKWWRQTKDTHINRMLGALHDRSPSSSEQRVWLPHLLWQHLLSPGQFQWELLPGKVSETFPDVVCLKGVSSDCDAPHTAFPHHQNCSLELMNGGLPVRAALAIDGWVYWTEQQPFGSRQSGPRICMIAHSETGPCTRSILAWLPARSAEPAPAVMSHRFKQGLPGAGPGGWGETVC